MHLRQSLWGSRAPETSCSLQVQMEVMMGRPGSVPKVPVVDDEARAVALRLMKEPGASVSQSLALCGSALARGWPEDAVFQLLSAIQARPQFPDLGPADVSEVLRFKLNLAATSARTHHEAPPPGAAPEDFKLGEEAPLERLERCAAELVAMVGARPLPGLTDAAGRILWSFGCAMRAVNWELAVAWLRRAASLLVVAPIDAANCLCAAGVCFHREGRSGDALDCANKALRLKADHLESLLLLVVSSAAQCKLSGPHAAFKIPAQACLESLRQHPGLRLAHAASVAKELLETSDEDLMFGALELFASCAAKASPEAGEDLDLSRLAAVRDLVERAMEKQRPDADLLRYLEIAAELVMASRFKLLEEPLGGGVEEVWRLLQAAWAKGQRLGRQGRWPSCAEVFEAAHKLLEPLKGTSELATAPTLSEMLLARVWCLVLAASARVQQAKELPGKPQERSVFFQRALGCLDQAHRICRQLGSDDAGHDEQGCQRRKDFSRVFTVLVLLEFEVRCFSGNSEQQLREFVDEASSQEVVGIVSLLAMSKIAGAASYRRLAIHCLQRYLLTFVGARGVMDHKQIAAAYREILALHASRNESFAIFEGILHLLSGAGGCQPAEDSSLGGTYPKDEIAWLVATAWNHEANFYRLQQYRWGERWMAKSLALAKFCPGTFSDELMTKGYTAVPQALRAVMAWLLPSSERSSNICRPVSLVVRPVL
ncbi:unnamed protein product [Polarella glacialis]|uniref:Protein ZIP4 homolog n=1 Tax=Polarella glacialis TaxID=89957 RepID=A0A813HMA8_POLGL|nr:unnamed protein product [Polarella glacialis]CAE8638712.1 unnamed protein product [Polarella glacialis]